MNIAETPYHKNIYFGKVLVNKVMGWAAGHWVGGQYISLNIFPLFYSMKLFFLHLTLQHLIFLLHVL